MGGVGTGTRDDSGYGRWLEVASLSARRLTEWGGPSSVYLSMTEIPKRELCYSVSGRMELAADVYGHFENPPVILLHGGGQTRHAWGGTAEKLAAAGFYALSLDLRGHGDSRWCSKEDYSLEAYVEDLWAVIQTLDQPPALVGASLGGMVSMALEGEIHPGSSAAVVLVDITPRIERSGVDRIVEFMTANPEGYASLEDAARAIQEYLPHRRAAKSLEGLSKNLRVGEDGRYRWHWDPAFLSQAARRGERPAVPNRLHEAAKNFRVPTLLVRGRMSDIVSEETAQEFLAAVPHAEYVDVKDAAHMVAGDQNDVFSDAVVGFLTRVIDNQSRSQSRVVG